MPALAEAPAMMRAAITYASCDETRRCMKDRGRMTAAADVSAADFMAASEAAHRTARVALHLILRWAERKDVENRVVTGIVVTATPGAPSWDEQADLRTVDRAIRLADSRATAATTTLASVRCADLCSPDVESARKLLDAAALMIKGVKVQRAKAA